MIPVDCVRQTAAQRRNQVLEAITSIGQKEKIDSLVFFGHGWPNGIQLGIRRKEIPDLVWHCRRYCSKSLVTILYACLAAENDVRDREVKRIGPATKGGFADELARQLGAAGFSGWGDAHKTSAHTTWNPYVIRFQMKSETPRAAWLVEPGSQLWDAWRRAVKGTNVRFEFPYWVEIDLKVQLWVPKLMGEDE
jgi:hypothetical protein